MSRMLRSLLTPRARAIALATAAALALLCAFAPTLAARVSTALPAPSAVACTTTGVGNCLTVSSVDPAFDTIFGANSSATAGVAFQMQATGNAGVFQSSLTNGVVGETANGSATTDTSENGVLGIDLSTDTGFLNYGVLGVSTYGTGASGFSTYGPGIIGETTNPSSMTLAAQVGIFALDGSTDGGVLNTGMLGVTTTGTATEGDAEGLGGFGVMGISDDALGGAFATYNLAAQPQEFGLEALDGYSEPSGDVAAVGETYHGLAGFFGMAVNPSGFGEGAVIGRNDAAVSNLDIGVDGIVGAGVPAATGGQGIAGVIFGDPTSTGSTAANATVGEAGDTAGIDVQEFTASTPDTIPATSGYGFALCTPGTGYGTINGQTVVDVASLDEQGNLLLCGDTFQATTPLIVSRGSDGVGRVSYTPRSAEPTMEDVGEGSLSGGYGHVVIDGALAAQLDPHTSYMVFITPEGNTNGVYVTNKTPRGFDVHENNGGRSSVTFDYRIVASPNDIGPSRLPAIAPGSRLAKFFLGAHRNARVAIDQHTPKMLSPLWSRADDLKLIPARMALNHQNAKQLAKKTGAQLRSKAGKAGYIPVKWTPVSPTK
jgi:hypothetical protein